MTKKELLKKIAHFETITDHLESEIAYVDQLMRTLGFPDGLNSLKVTAKEMIDEGVK